MALPLLLTPLLSGLKTRAVSQRRRENSRENSPGREVTAAGRAAAGHLTLLAWFRSALSAVASEPSLLQSASSFGTLSDLSPGHWAISSCQAAPPCHATARAASAGHAQGRRISGTLTGTDFDTGSERAGLEPSAYINEDRRLRGIVVWAKLLGRPSRGGCVTCVNKDRGRITVTAKKFDATWSLLLTPRQWEAIDAIRLAKVRRRSPLLFE